VLKSLPFDLTNALTAHVLTITPLCLICQQISFLKTSISVALIGSQLWIQFVGFKVVLKHWLEYWFQ